MHVLHERPLFHNEVIDHILVAEECEYIEHTLADAIIDEIKTSIIVLNGYIKYLKARKENG